MKKYPNTLPSIVSFDAFNIFFLTDATSSCSLSVSIEYESPKFTKKQLASAKSYQKYGKLDNYGRATSCIACIGKEIMPTTKRGSIGMIKPSGWHLVKYDFVDGKYLYNRCHLIAYELTGVDGKSHYLAQNLVTGTRYMNIEGQLPYENMTTEYIKSTGNHVLYRSTPIFIGDNLLCSGVHMEAESIEDNGKGIKFNVYCYNERKNYKRNMIFT